MTNRQKIYLKAGEALDECQSLEQCIIIVIASFRGECDEEARKPFKVIPEDKRTLGLLIKEFHKLTGGQDVLMEILMHALDSRNYVIHNFFKRNFEALSDEKQERFELSMKLLDDHLVNVKRGVFMLLDFTAHCANKGLINPKEMIIRQDNY